MADKFNAAGFNNDKNYEIQIKNRGKNSGITYEFQEDLQKYIDEGIFIDELNNGFTGREKSQLAREFQILHEEKGYDTNFNKMKAGTTFSYTAEDYVRLAKAAGYVLKDMSPQEAAALQKQLEAAAKEFNQKSDVQVAEPAPKVVPTESEAVQTVDITALEPAKISVPEEKLDTEINPLTVAEPEPDPFALNENDPAFQVPDVKPINPDDIEPDPEQPDEPSNALRLPNSFLKREHVTPEEFGSLPPERQAELVDKYYDRPHSRNIFARIFGKKSSTPFPPPDNNLAQK